MKKKRKIFLRRVGQRLAQIATERGWTEDDFKRMEYNFKSWERHRRGDGGMQQISLLKICEMAGLKVWELLKGTDDGIYEPRPVVFRRARRRASGRKK